MSRCTTQWAQIDGRRECDDAEVATILKEIVDQCGGATLHRITPSNIRGAEYLEAAGRNSMLGPEDMAVDENAGDVGGAHTADVVHLVTMNVAGLCSDLKQPTSARMDEILTKLLADENPDVLCFQEMTDEMYRNRKARNLIFDTEPLCGPEPWPMVLPHLSRPRTGSLVFPLPSLFHKMSGRVLIHDRTEVVLKATRTPATLFVVYIRP